MTNRVKQISIDVIVDESVDGIILAKEIADCLEKNGYNVSGADFSEDLTEEYKDYLKNEEVG